MVNLDGFFFSLSSLFKTYYCYFLICQKKNVFFICSYKELYNSAIRDPNEEKTVLNDSDSDSDDTRLVLCTCWKTIALPM